MSTCGTNPGEYYWHEWHRISDNPSESKSCVVNSYIHVSYPYIILNIRSESYLWTTVHGVYIIHTPLLLHSSSPSHLGCSIQGWFDKPKPTWSSGTAIAVPASFRWLWEIQAPTVLADFVATSWKSLGLWHFLGWSLGANGVQRIFQGEADVRQGEMKTGFVLVRDLFGCGKSFDTLAVCQGAHPSLISMLNLHLKVAKI